MQYVVKRRIIYNGLFSLKIKLNEMKQKKDLVTKQRLKRSVRKRGSMNHDHVYVMIDMYICSVEDLLNNVYLYQLVPK